MNAPDAHPLIAAYLEQREDLARFFQARLAGKSGDVDDLLHGLDLKLSGLDPQARSDNPRAFLFKLASNLLMDRWRSGRCSAERDSEWRRSNHVVSPVEDVGDAPSAEAVVFVDNLFDTAANTFAYSDPFRLPDAQAITPLRPLTAGLTLRLSR